LADRSIEPWNEVGFAFSSSIDPHVLFWIPVTERACASSFDSRQTSLQIFKSFTLCFFCDELLELFQSHSVGNRSVNDGAPDEILSFKLDDGTAHLRFLHVEAPLTPAAKRAVFV
jgi:hypothetical protein